ncbi:MAG: potassium channel family protein [Terriglobales bacterium]
MVGLAAIVGTAVVLAVLWDTFETIVLPRRVTRKIRITRLFYQYSWAPAKWLAKRYRNPRRRDSFLALYGPLSLLLLLMTWAAGLVIGFATLQWAAGTALEGTQMGRDFGTDVYFSGSTLFTLGMGDVHPTNSVARALSVVEAGLGFGFLALVISYLPVVYQSFSRRELHISLLDARAGTPPTATELLRRNSGDGMKYLDNILHEWEHWAADLLESHISYPVLAYFRSQHDNQSWITALTAVLDAAALCQAGVQGAPVRQSQLTFAMARHAIVDLAQVFNTAPLPPPEDRLPSDRLQRLRMYLADAGVKVDDGPTVERRLADLRAMYEPYVNAMATHFLVELPPWMRSAEARDNWKTSRWGGAMTA